MTLENEKKTRKINHNAFLLQVKEFLPVISVVMVFLGYWNLDSFYGKFGIEIYNYVTASEILLSFLPIINTIVLTVISLLIIGLVLFFPEFEERKQDPQISNIEDESDVTLNIIRFCKNFYKFISLKWYQKNNRFHINVITFIIRLIALTSNVVAFFFVLAGFILIFTSLYGYNLTVLGNNNIASMAIAALLVILALRFLHLNFFAHVEPVNLFIEKYSLVGTSAILILVLISTQNVTNANEILQKKTDVLVTFTVDEKTITTDSNLVYVGNTQNYLFLRKLKQRTNIIYKVSDIKNLEIIDTE